MAVQQVRAELGLQAERRQRFDDDVDVDGIPGRRRGIDDADHVAGSQAPRLARCCRPRWLPPAREAAVANPAVATGATRDCCRNARRVLDMREIVPCSRAGADHTIQGFPAARMAGCRPVVRRADIRRAVAAAGALADARARAPRHAVQHVAAVVDCRGAHDAAVAAARSADLPSGHASARVLGRRAAAGAPRDAAARGWRADPAGQQRDPPARPVAVRAGDVPARARSPRGVGGRDAGSRERDRESHRGIGTRRACRGWIAPKAGTRYPAPGTRCRHRAGRRRSPGRSSRCCRIGSST